MTEAITEYRNENTKDIDLLSTIDMVRKMNEEDQIVAQVVADEAPNIATAIDTIAKTFLPQKIPSTLVLRTQDILSSSFVR